MVDAQENHEEEEEEEEVEEFEDPQREFATPAGSQSGESPDLLGEPWGQWGFLRAVVQ